jgi:hypothetical protein
MVAMNGPVLYEIWVQGELGEQWSAWFAGMAVEAQPDGTSVLRGVLADQAALHGVLARMRDLGLPLLRLEQLMSVDGQDHLRCQA